jgi:transcription elongation GreA/GreB family factor
MSQRISNAEFLQRYESEDFGRVILPQEKDLIEKRLADLDASQKRVIQEKKDVAGGDDWHDGAFRATDNEANVLFDQASKLGAYLRSTIIEYPDEDETRATLGSRVTVSQSGDTYDVEIVGVPLLHETVTSDDVMACSIESPLARSIIGKQVGYTAIFNVGDRRQQAEVVSIDQTAMRRFVSDDFPKE